MKDEKWKTKKFGKNSKEQKENDGVKKGKKNATKEERNKKLKARKKLKQIKSTPIGLNS